MSQPSNLDHSFALFLANYDEDADPDYVPGEEDSYSSDSDNDDITPTNDDTAPANAEPRTITLRSGRVVRMG